MKYFTLSILLFPLLAFSQAIYTPGITMGASPSAVPTPDILWLQLIENTGTAITDSSPEGHNGTINRSGQWEPDGSTFAITNNGTADFAKTTASVVYGTNKATIAFRLFLTGAHAAVTIIAESTANLNSNDGAFSVQDTGDGATLSFATHDAGGSPTTFEDVTVPLPSNGAWHRVLWVIDRSAAPNVFKIYIDRVLQTQTVVFSGGAAANIANAQLFMASRASTSLFWFGGLGDFRIYSGDQSGLVGSIPR